MQLDLTQLILDLDDKPVKLPGEQPVPLTIGMCCQAPLLHAFPDEPDISPEFKVKRFNLAVRIARGGTINLGNEDVSILKAVVGKYWSPLIVGRVWQALDPVAMLDRERVL